MVIAVCSLVAGALARARARVRRRASARPAPRRSAPPRPRRSSPACSTRTACGRGAAPLSGAALRRASASWSAAAARADRRRPRQRRLPPPRARACSARRTLDLGWEEYAVRLRLTCTVNGERARGRRRLGGREPAHTCCATGSTCRAPRTPASRASAARARSTSTASSCARASCSPARPRAARSSPSRGCRRARRCTPSSRRSSRPARVQCGFCTPGLIVASHDLLARNASPERRRDPRGAGRQPLPLHGLREDPRRRAAGGGPRGSA